MASGASLSDKGPTVKQEVPLWSLHTPFGRRGPGSDNHVCPFRDGQETPRLPQFPSAQRLATQGGERLQRHSLGEDNTSAAGQRKQ